MIQSNNSHIEYSFSKESAFSGSDVRAFIMPTFANHNRSDRPIFNTPDNESLSEAIEKNQNLDVFLNQSYITNLSGVSLSTHRDKTPITSLGRIDPLGFVASRRTVAGSMVFWMSDASPLSQLLSAEYRSELLHADELPPFDLYLTFLTENDMWSSTIIYGITILDEGMVIENANGEPIAVTYSYMAMDSTPVVPGFFGSVYERLYKKNEPVVSTILTGEVARNSDNNLVPKGKEVTKVKEVLESKIDPSIAKFTLTYLSDTNGSVSPSTQQIVNNLGNGVEVEAIANVGYHFLKWSDNCTEPKRIDKRVTANKTVTAIFALNTFTLTYLSGGNGYVWPERVQTVNYLGNGDEVEATADSDYLFVKWSDNLTTPKRTDKDVTANLTVTATFAIKTYTFTYTAGPHGTITGEEGAQTQIVNSGETGKRVTASPDPGYKFEGWSDCDSTDPQRTDYANRNITATATFVEDPPA